MLVREPRAALRPFVTQLWASGPIARSARICEPSRERVLPTGCAHLVFRPDASRLSVFDVRTRALSAELSHCVLAGPRSIAYDRLSLSNASSVGAVLRPGAARSVVGAPLSIIADAHFDANLVLGRGAIELCERLALARSAEAQLDELEDFLLARIASAPAPSAIVRRAVSALERDANASINAIVAESNASHRHVCALFEEHVGLTPKRFARVRRFDHAARELAGASNESIAAVAARLGFSDQAHFTREFTEHAALTPSAYARTKPSEHRHVPIDEGQFSSRRASARRP